MTSLDNKPAGGNGSYSTFENEEPPAEKGKCFTVEEAIEKIGFGRFQMFCSFAAGFAWIADGMEIMVLSIIGPTLLCEWGISTVQEALITTVVFIGFLLGSPAFGFFADKFGRRKSLLFSSIWISFYGILSALAPELSWLLFLRFLVGFGVGGGPQAITYFAEFLPNKSRGRAVVLVEIFWAVGSAFEVILAILILMPFGWRWWLGVSAFPSCIFVILCIWLPNSPRFDLITGNTENAHKTLKMAARWNREELPEGYLVSEPEVPRGLLIDLWRPGFKLSSGLLAILWFSAAFCYYGVVLFTTSMITVGTTCNPDIFASVSQGNNGTCQLLTLLDYEDLLWTSAAELPGLLVTAVLVDLIGRKKTLIIETFIFGVICLLLMICMQRTAMLFLLFCARAFIASVFQVLYVYTPEIYPTQVRALSVGIGSMFGRFGAIITPYVAQVLIDLSLYYGLGVYAAIGFISFIVACCLPIETKGRDLNKGGSGAQTPPASMSEELELKST